MVEAVVKQGTTTRTGTATNTVDPDLVFPLAASTIYWAGINFRGIAGATNDFKLNIDFTGTVNYVRFGGVMTANQSAWTDMTSVGSSNNIGNALLVFPGGPLTINGSATADSHYGGTYSGLISVNGAGDLQFKWAQNTSGGNTATIEAGSAIYCIPITEMDEEFIIKAADEPRSNTTVLADDSELVLNLEANKKYIINLHAFYNALATPDLKYAVSITGSPTAIASGTVERNVGSTDVRYGNTRGTFHTNPSTTTVVGVDPATNRGFTEYNLAVIMGGSPGVFSFQWAQNTSSATAITVFAGSYIKYQEVP